MIPARVAPIHRVVGSTAPSGPPADRSGVVKASMNAKVTFSSHSPADHSPIIADVHTSPTTAEAASPSQFSGFQSNVGSRAGHTSSGQRVRHGRPSAGPR